MNFNIKFLLVLILTIATLVVGRILYVKIQTREIKEEYPIEKIKFYKHWVTVFPKQNTRLNDFVDMSLFYNFKPNMTFDETTKLFGKPNNIRENKGNIYYEYSKQKSRIEVAKEEYSTGDNNNPIGVSWALYTYPKDDKYDHILSKRISKYVPLTSKETVVTIMKINDEPGILVFITGNRVEYIVWYK